MPLPEFNETSDLPVGVHPAPLSEILNRFGQKPRKRQILSERLKRIYAFATETNQVARFVIFGSFITNKEEPNDIDVFLVMDDDFDVSRLVGEQRLLFDHTVAQDHFGASIFWVRKIAAFGGEQTAVEHWQIKRDGNRRGIVEVIEEGL